MKFVLYPPGTPFQQEIIYFHGRFPLPASITRKVHICFHHVCACSCHVLPILNDVKGSPSMAKVPTPHMPWFCWVTKQCNRSCRLQVILGTDRFIRPKNLKGALYSRDACTFSNQPWMISRYFKAIKALWARKFDKDDYSLKVIFLSSRVSKQT
jgi:hypothetical protein